MTLEPLQTVASATVNLLLSGEFVWATRDNLSGFETAVIKQVDNTPLTFIGQEILNDCPALVLMIGVLNEQFIGGTRLRKAKYFFTCIGTQSVDNHTIETE